MPLDWKASGKINEEFHDFSFAVCDPTHLSIGLSGMQNFLFYLSFIVVQEWFGLDYSQLGAGKCCWAKVNKHVFAITISISALVIYCDITLYFWTVIPNIKLNIPNNNVDPDIWGTMTIYKF